MAEDELGLIKPQPRRRIGKSRACRRVFMVPALQARCALLGYARGAIFGITRESIRITGACRTGIHLLSDRDILTVMEEDSGVALSSLKVDGGASANEFLIQFQSDILGVSGTSGQSGNHGTGAAFLPGSKQVSGRTRKDKNIWSVGKEFLREWRSGDIPCISNGKGRLTATPVLGTVGPLNTFTRPCQVFINILPFICEVDFLFGTTKRKSLMAASIGC